MAPALFQTRKIEWESVGRPPIRDLYRALIAFRKENKAMTSGEMVWLENSRKDEVVTFLRKKDGKEVLVAINLSNRPLEVSLPITKPDEFRPVEFPGHLKKGVGTPTRLQLPGFGWSVMERKEPKT
jgi:glycosidase